MNEVKVKAMLDKLGPMGGEVGPCGFCGNTRRIFTHEGVNPVSGKVVDGAKVCSACMMASLPGPGPRS